MEFGKLHGGMAGASYVCKYPVLVARYKLDSGLSTGI